MTKAKTQAEALAAYNTDVDLRAAKSRMGLALPEDGWLGDYVRAVTPLTDAPVEFHLVSGLSAIAAAIGNRLYAEHWGQNVFPHLWAVLVAPSSFWRKSTSINQAETLLRAAAEKQSYPSDFSREKLLGLLADQPSGMLTVKEFGGFLAALGRDYNAGTKETLTELYDGPDLYVRALQTKVVQIKRPALTLLGATTLDWLENKIVDGDLASGFLPRFLWVTAREKASGKGLTAGMDPVLKVRLTTGLHSISEGAERMVEYEPDAHALLDDWMQGWETEATKSGHRADLSGFAVRLQTYAVKLSMLYRVSRTYGDDLADHIVDVAAVTQAIAYCRLLLANVTSLLDDQIAITRDARELRRIRTIVGAGITKTEALRLAHMKARDFDQLLDTLVATRELYKWETRASEVGLQRQRDSKVMWLSPTPPPSANGSYDSLGTHYDSQAWDSLEVAGTHSEPVPIATRSELQGSDLSTESPYRSHSLSLSFNDESRTRVVGDTREGSESQADLVAQLSRLNDEGKVASLVEATGLGELTIRRELDEHGLAGTVERWRSGALDPLAGL